MAKQIDLTESAIYGILKTGKEKERFQVEFGSAGKDISYETKGKIEEMKLPGITFTRSMKRFYPNGIFASHVIGFTENVQDKNNKIKQLVNMGFEKSLRFNFSG